MAKDILEPTLYMGPDMKPMPVDRDLVSKHAPLRRASNVMVHILHHCGFSLADTDHSYEVLDPKIEEGVETGRFLAAIHGGSIILEFINNIDIQEVYDQCESGILGGVRSLNVGIAGNSAELVKNAEKFGVVKVLQMAHSQFAQVIERVLLNHGYVIGKNAVPRERNTITAYTLLPFATRVRIRFTEDRIELGTNTTSTTFGGLI